MKKPDMQTMICNIHNVHFAAERAPKMDYFPCPYCEHERANGLLAEVVKLKGQRDALLRAIEIKQTVELVP